MFAIVTSKWDEAASLGFLVGFLRNKIIIGFGLRMILLFMIILLYSTVFIDSKYGDILTIHTTDNLA